MSVESSMSEAQHAWVQRVLGVTVPGKANPGNAGPGATAATASVRPQDWAAARGAWQVACDAIDGQISTLQSALRADGDDTLKQIAEFGMNALTGNHRVQLMAAFAEIGGGDPALTAKLAPGTVRLIQAFRTFLESDEKIEVCDDNPFGVKVTIRNTLGAALGRMEALLQAKAP